jgi:NAD(P)H-hydrate epimerase
MTRAITAEQAREIDRRAVEECGLSSLVLMENAGRGAVDVLTGLGIGGPVLICCGSGNNGGDGLVMARHLDLRGFAVHVAIWGEPSRYSPDTSANLRVLQHCDVPIESFTTDSDLLRLRELLSGVDWIVDALFGTGFRGPLRAPFANVITALNAAPARRLAVDLPSGMNADTGECAEPTIRADHTVTFVAPKMGFESPAARAVLGQVHVTDIGAPRKLVDFVAGSSSPV